MILQCLCIFENKFLLLLICCRNDVHWWVTGVNSATDYRYQFGNLGEGIVNHNNNNNNNNINFLRLLAKENLDHEEFVNNCGSFDMREANAER